MRTTTLTNTAMLVALLATPALADDGAPLLTPVILDAPTETGMFPALEAGSLGFLAELLPPFMLDMLSATRQMTVTALTEEALMVVPTEAPTAEEALLQEAQVNPLLFLQRVHMMEGVGR